VRGVRGGAGGRRLRAGRQDGGDGREGRWGGKGSDGRARGGMSSTGFRGWPNQIGGRRAHGRPIHSTLDWTPHGIGYTFFNIFRDPRETN
jgi:hypothetical protein